MVFTMTRSESDSKSNVRFQELVVGGEGCSEGEQEQNFFLGNW
jgi:hypothetical protein